MTTVQLESPLTIVSITVTQAVVGTPERDVITGSAQGEALSGGQGKDRISGGGGPDAFIFENERQFGKQLADAITDFNPKAGDKIVLPSKIFGGITKIRFLATSGKRATREASSSNKTIVYNESSGKLYFNANGRDRGWGDGGLFAKLLDAPEIGLDDLALA